MKVLILGWSDIVVRRVLPACLGLGVERIDLASRSRPVRLPAGVPGVVFDDYAPALAASPADLVWVSTQNHLHAPLARAALEAGYHVVIDKPATLALADTEALVATAARRGRLLAEATVYAFHPQIEAIRGVFAALGEAPTRISAWFGYPPLDQDNFRWRAEPGGGVLWDLGPYAVSVGRLFFGAAPQGLHACAVRAPRDAVPTSLSLLACYPGGRTLVGHFSMRSEYVNRLELCAPTGSVCLERAFTTPPDQAPCLRTRSGGCPGEHRLPAADAFACFLAAVRSAVADGDHGAFAAAMLADARVLDRVLGQVGAAGGGD
jgi:predicted dehydrogenase